MTVFEFLMQVKTNISVFTPHDYFVHLWVTPPERCCCFDQIHNERPPTQKLFEDNRCHMTKNCSFPAAKQVKCLQPGHKDGLNCSISTCLCLLLT